MACAHCDNKKKTFLDSTKWKISALVISVVALAFSFFWRKLAGNSIAMYFDPAYIAIILCGIPLFITAFHNLFKEKKIVSSLLISVAIVATIALNTLSYFIEVGGHDHATTFLFAGGEIAVLMMLGDLIEDYTVNKSRSGIMKLISLRPSTAWVKLMNEYIQMEVEFVEIGDLVMIKPNERISVDGVIESGSSSVDMSSITGESLPVDVSSGSSVYAGTLNTYQTLYVRVSKKSNDTTVSKMIKMVEEAEKNKAPIARIADKWSGYIVPAALILSVVVGLFVGFILGETWDVALVRGVTILVVFCPCSLALATPTAVAAGIGNASYKGILIKSGKALETLAGVDAIAFDKTGTLTNGKLNVVNAFALNGDIDKLLVAAGSAEAHSEHPIAQAIVEYAKSKVKLVDIETTTSQVGVGVNAVVNGKKVVVAKVKSFSDYSNFDKVEEYANEFMSKGCTVVAVGVGGKLVGAIALSDTIKDSASQAVNNLNQMGINTIMLTGDNQLAADEVGKQVGVKTVKAQLMPQDKVTAVQQLKSEGATVCMVGDGVNDAPSLAAADCSIAMGAMGSDVALEVADMALLNNDMNKICGLVKFSKRVMRKIKGNIIFSMSVNLIAVIISTLGILDPVGGALLHNLSSIFVVTNSALLLLNKDIK